jgi:hypothetical protein
MGNFKDSLEEFQLKVADLWIDIAFGGKKICINDYEELARRLDKTTLIAIEICFKHGLQEAEKFLESDAQEFARNHLPREYYD